MSEPLVLYSLRAPAAILTLNRADKRNALSRALIASLNEAFQRARDDAAVRCVILTAAGSVFCAGMDLAELAESLDQAGKAQKSPAESPVWDDSLRLATLYDLIYRLPKPTIAAVNGAAVAGGAGLVSVCDLAVAVPEARFGYPEVRRGLVAAMVMPHLLRHVGERTARYLLLTGDLIDAAEACRTGLVNAVADGPQLLQRAHEWACSLAEGGPQALAGTKNLLHQFSHQTLSVAEAARASAAPRLSEECQQGLRAFFAKRPAPWSSAPEK
jgi:methylglutaconyl-CoA hydratase